MILDSGLLFLGHPVYAERNWMIQSYSVYETIKG